MIIARLLGGLGNQMFQYAAAYSVAQKNKTIAAVDNDWFVSKNSTVWHMNYELDCFSISAAQITPNQYSITESKPNLLSILQGSKEYTEYREKSMRYDPEVFNLGKDVVLDGYWQSEKYFKQVRSGILNEFSFTTKLQGKNLETKKLITKSNSVSLHVRRGDYANHAETNAFHGLMGLDYYRAAIESIAKRIDTAHFFVFSDEPEWCEKNLKIDYPHTFVTGNKKGCYDMQLMSLCNHHILANSSFSWWGAWLNTNPKKIVVAPKRWFNNASMDAADLVPEIWERI